MAGYNLFAPQKPVYQENALLRGAVQAQSRQTAKDFLPGKKQRPQGSVSATKETLGDVLHRALTAGTENTVGKRMAEKLATVADFSPVGAVAQSFDAGADIRKGNYVQGTVNALLNLIPDGGGKLGGAVAHSIIAPLWHGSPHKFEKFALEKIGTGEGSQVRGHGLYFSESKEVADQYRPLGVWNKKEDRIVPQGQLYEVSLNANPDEFVDWDAPLAQTAHGQALADVMRNYGLGDYSADAGAMAYKQAAMHGNRQFGDQLRLFKDAAVPGVTHMDNGLSGSRFHDVRNYVVFDPSIIDITGRY